MVDPPLDSGTVKVFKIDLSLITVKFNNGTLGTSKADIIENQIPLKIINQMHIILSIIINNM